MERPGNFRTLQVLNAPYKFLFTYGEALGETVTNLCIIGW